MIPFDPGSIFPSGFGLNYEKHAKTGCWGNVCYSLNAEHFREEEEDEPMEWYLFDENFSDASAEEGDVDEPCSAHSRASIYMYSIMALVHIRKKQKHAEEMDDQSSVRFTLGSEDFDCFRASPRAESRSEHRFSLAHAVERFPCQPNPKPPISGLHWWQRRCSCGYMTREELELGDGDDAKGDDAKIHGIQKVRPAAVYDQSPSTKLQHSEAMSRLRRYFALAARFLAIQAIGLQCFA